MIASKCSAVCLLFVSTWAGVLSSGVDAQVDAIEKLAMLNTRDVRTILHVLFQQGYLSMQELPRTADRTPSKTIFLYHVNFNAVLGQLRIDLCTAAGATPSVSLAAFGPKLLASPHVHDLCEIAPSACIL
jgi:hypothetical protein